MLSFDGGTRFNNTCSMFRTPAPSEILAIHPIEIAKTFLAGSAEDRLHQLLDHCVALGASDLHLGSGELPFFRNRGRMLRAEGYSELDAGQIRDLAHFMVGESLDDQMSRRGAIDGSLTGRDGSRYRFNVYVSQGVMAIAIRRLDDTIRPLSELGLPDSLYSLADLRDGLVVVSGPTGSGKSTTLATLIDRINREHQSHIITIEDPVEYLHPSQRSLVHQRQLGIDCPSFQDALVASLRQDPDVILVGEIRELETIRIAITAAETGHLVFTTVHAGDSVGVIERITSVFPAEEQAGVRRQLALVLRANISQKLIVADGPAVVADEKRGSNEVKRRVIASEIMRVNSAVANLVASGKSQQIYSVIESGSNAGMQTLDQDLARLMKQGLISERTAMAYAHNPAIVADRFARLRQRRIS
ncbi:MAG: PilT/PilU family type 4a pilus ATPase [Planctomycetota bacterium]